MYKRQANQPTPPKLQQPPVPDLQKQPASGIQEPAQALTPTQDSSFEINVPLNISQEKLERIRDIVKVLLQ